jgi:hypothetical protein
MRALTAKLAVADLVAVVVWATVILVGYVVIVGGLVCILNASSYPFSAYITDLQRMSKYVLAAAIAAASKFVGAAVITSRSGETASRESTSRTCPAPDAPTEPRPS